MPNAFCKTEYNICIFHVDALFSHFVGYIEGRHLINKNVFIIIIGHGVFHEHISSIVIPIVPQHVMARFTKPVSMTGVDILN